MIHRITFLYEVEALGQSMTVTVIHTPSSYPGDPGPDGEGEIEVTSVTLNGQDVDTDGIKVCKMKGGWTDWPNIAKARLIPEWFRLTALIIEAAWEEVKREAA